MSGLRFRFCRSYANQCVYLFSRMHQLPRSAAASGRRLLRVLFLRFGQVPADAAVAVVLFGRCRTAALTTPGMQFMILPPNLSLNADAPRRACGPFFVAPVSLLR